MELLSKNRVELESLFRHFDVNGDEKISTKEFKEGILSLQTLIEDEKQRFTEEDVDVLIRYLDENHDKYISYREFFQSFQLTHDNSQNQKAPTVVDSASKR